MAKKERVNLALGYGDNNNLDIRIACLRNVKGSEPYCSNRDPLCMATPSTLQSLSRGTKLSASVGVAAVELASLINRKRVTGLTPVKSLGVGKRASQIGKDQTVVEAKIDVNGCEHSFIVIINADIFTNNDGKDCYSFEARGIDIFTFDDGTLNKMEINLQTCGYAIPLLIACLYSLNFILDDSETELCLKEIGDMFEKEDIATSNSLIRPCTILTSALNFILQENDQMSPVGSLYSDFGRLQEISFSDIQSGYLLPKRENRLTGSCYDFLDVDAARAKVFLGEIDDTYYIDPERILSEEEKQLVPVIGSETTIPTYVVDAAKTAKACDFRYFLFEGTPGGGKSVSATILSSLCGLPHLKMICHAGTTAEDIIGYFVPKTRMLTDPEKNVQEDSAPQITAEDMVYAPIDAYKAITGRDKTEQGNDPTSDDCMLAYARKLQEDMKTATESKGKEDFVLVPSELTLAVMNGWCIELQEVAAIVNANVLKVLNQLFDDSQKMRLVTGETIRRHPDTVVVFTGNIGSVNDHELDNSLRDRIQFCYTVEMPSTEEAIERAIAQTGFDNKPVLTEMLSLIEEMRTELKEMASSFYDRVGMRSLINWAKVVSKTHEFNSSCRYCVIDKITGDAEIKTELEKIYEKHRIQFDSLVKECDAL